MVNFFFLIILFSIYTVLYFNVILFLFRCQLLNFPIVVTILGFCSSLFITFVFFYVIIFDVTVIVYFFTWAQLNFITINWCFLFDSLSVSMCFIIIIISFFVNLYSLSYMKMDANINRFFSYVALFTFFMLFLVTSENFIQLFLGWEGVGICSFLLISFWHTRILAVKSAMKAIFLNRVGDFFLLAGFLLLFIGFKSFDFSIIFLLAPYFESVNVIFLSFYFDYISLVCFFLVIGAMGKSAQLGLHIWLPDAMEGPTPVSALIHAATMVTAGIFLILRCSILFEYSPMILLLILFIGGFTAFFGAIMGLVQTDLKRIIAFSTCSQLGYMFFICGLSGYNAALFHLMTHAFFKALLFLCAGAIIHATFDEQDIRRMGGLYGKMPLIFLCFCVGSCALIGFPFFSGYFSKDFILELVYSRWFSVNSYFLYNFIHNIGLITALLTALYSWRLIYFVFFHKSRTNILITNSTHKTVPPLILLSLVLLSFLSVIIGYFLFTIFITADFPVFKNSLFLLDDDNLIYFNELPFYIKYMPTLCCFFGISIVYIFIYFVRTDVIFQFLFFTFFGSAVFAFLFKKWFFDYLYNFGVVKYSFLLCQFFYKQVDKGFVEFFGPALVTICLTLCPKIFTRASIYVLFLIYLRYSFYFLVFIIIIHFIFYALGF